MVKNNVVFPIIGIVGNEMIKHKKFHVLYTPSDRVAFALYPENVIILNEKLMDYPELHEFVLSHEKKHLEYGFNLLKQLSLDLRDRFTVLKSGRLYWQYKSCLKNGLPAKEKVKLILFGLGYQLGSLGISFILLPLIIFRELQFLWRKRNANFKEKEDA